MKKQIKNKNGFTLVELIVVLVILGILAAMLVPALSGYITKSKEKAAITECRKVVEASQTVASNAKTEGKLKGVFDLTDYPNLKKEISSLAEVSGTIQDVNRIEETGSKIVLVNYEAANGIKVVYDIYWEDHNRDDLYSIVRNLYGRLEQFAVDSGTYFKENGFAKFDKNGKLIWCSDDGGINGLAAQGLLPKAEEKYWEGQDVYWKPYMMGTGETFLFANTYPDRRGEWKAMLVYVNGKVYKSTSQKGTEISQVNSHRENSDTVEAYIKSLGFEEFKG